MQTKQKRTQTQTYKTHSVLPETEATLMFQQMTYIDAHELYFSDMQSTQCKNGRYRLLADYQCISILNNPDNILFDLLPPSCDAAIIG